MSDIKSKYQSKLTTKEELVKGFKPGDYVQLGVWYGEPYGTMAAISEHCKGIDPLYIAVNIATSPSEYLHNDGIYCLTCFHGPHERASQKVNDNVYYMPYHFTDAQRMVKYGKPFDYFIHRVGPMDDRGMVNFGMTASWEYNAIQWIKVNCPDTKIVFEINPNMPKVYGIPECGDNELSIDFADLIVEDDTPLLDYPTPPPNETEQAIARNVACLIEDKTTIQLGFGTIPMAIGQLLKDRKDLGVHTEMFCDAHVDLIESGSVTNAHKGLYEGRSVATFALGTKRMHEFLRENAEFAMLPVEAVNSVTELAKVNRMASVNSLLTVDMTGQACAHCLGTQTYSGLGGAFEFAYGSQLSPGGHSISCLPSTTTLKDSTVVSNIVPQHEKGTRVTIPEHCIDWVVTEYGAARLKFMTLEQRAQALIDIAHPDFREDLARQMKDAGMRMHKIDDLPELPSYFFARAEQAGTGVTS